MLYDNNLGIRVGAYFIDSLILSLLMQILYAFNLGVEYEIYDGMIIQMLEIWQILLVYVIYFVGFALFNNGITVGKMVTGLEIRQGDYRTLKHEKIILREFLKVILTPLNVVSFIFVLASKENKALHDMIVDSIVVKYRKKVIDQYNLRENQVNNTFEENGETMVGDDEQSKSSTKERVWNQPDTEITSKDINEDNTLRFNGKDYVDPLDDTEEK